MRSGFFGAAFAIALTALVCLTATAQPSVPSLRDQNGKAFTLSKLGNTPVILTFVSAHCVDTCPIINAQFEAMQTLLRKSHVPVRLVTLTLDPERDSARDMQRIARTFDADARYWVIGSGSNAATHGLLREFNVTVSRGKRGYGDLHTTFVYLLDKRGHLVKTVLASTNLPGDLFAELQRHWDTLNG